MVAKLTYGLTQSLDGYVDHQKIGRPLPGLFRHFLEQTRDAAGVLYGSRTYAIMQYWDIDQIDWDQDECAYATAWRSRPKWVVSRSLKSVGPNARLLTGDLAAAVQDLKSDHDGEIPVSGPEIANSLTKLGLIDEYRLYLVPLVFGQGSPFFAGARPPLRHVAAESIGEEAFRLTYLPA